ncbi:unnamed protein product, partial [Rotaria sordida]
MFDNQGQLQRFGQKIIIHKRSSVSPAAPRVEKVAHQSRHRSLETKKKGAQGQSASIVYISVRQPKINQPNNNKSVNPPENLLSLSTILNSRHHRNKFNLPSPNKSASEWSRYMTHRLNETNVSSRLPSLLQTTQNIWDNNDLSISSTNKTNDLINTQERINNSQQQRFKSSAISRTLTVNSSRVSPNQNNPAQYVSQISNGNNVILQRQQLLRQPQSQLLLVQQHQQPLPRLQHQQPLLRLQHQQPLPGLQHQQVLPALQHQQPLPGLQRQQVLPALQHQQLLPRLQHQQPLPRLQHQQPLPGLQRQQVLPALQHQQLLPRLQHQQALPLLQHQQQLPGLQQPQLQLPVSTTTTRLNCGQSCLNQSWVDSSGDFVQWPFDGSYIDIMINRNGTPSSNQPAFVTGYFGQACSFNASVKQSIYTSFIPLNNVSFTIEAWIKPTGYPNPTDHSIVGLCPSQSTRRCLHINIRNTKLHFGFFSDDLQGATTISLNQWIHIAFVFDATRKQQTIYLKGVQDGQASASSALLMTSGNFTIGTNEQVNVPNNYYQGYIDHLSVSRRAKSSCEILEIATLAAHFEFDSASSYTDSGPNAVATTYSTTSIISGYKNEAISFSGSSTSYFQAWGFTSLGVSTLVHLSSSPSGNGSTCFSL